MSAGQESNEFAALLAEAEEYDGFVDPDDEYTSDEDTEDQDVQDAGEGLDEDLQEDEEPEAPTGTEDEGDEPQYEVTLPGGEKATVSLSELLAGYSRTADYTRKTQALATERRAMADALAIAQALDRNPQATLETLARHYQVALPGTTQDDEDEFLTEDERFRRETQARFAAQDRAQREAAIDQEIGRLHTKYGAFDEDALFAHAVATNTMNLEIALQSMVFQAGLARQGQPPQGEQVKQQAVAKQTKKRSAGAAGGASPAAASKPVVEEHEIRTMADAYEYAKQVVK